VAYFRLLVAIAIIVSLAALAGCGGGLRGPSVPGGVQVPPDQSAGGVNPPATSGAAAGSASLPANSKVAYSLALTKDGQPAIYRARAIEGARVANGVLALKTTTEDGNLDLFATPLAQGLKPPLWLKVEMSNTVPGTWGEAYWDTGAGMSEKTAVLWKLPGDGAMHTYTVKLNADGPVRGIRFDPSAKADTINIKSLAVFAGQ
jgi:hypothetical protein